MAITASGAEPHSPSSDSPTPPPAHAASRRWSVDEIVVAAFAFLGILGAIFFPLLFSFQKVPPISASFLLATGIAALTYRWLGGIEGSALTIGALKLTGTLAALVGIAMLINGQLFRQTSHSQIWYLSGKVTDQSQKPIDQLNDADFTVFPGAGHAFELGDFNVAFIRDDQAPTTDRIYLHVNHKGFGPVTIPLEVSELKSAYPQAKIKDTQISIDQIMLPPASGLDTPYATDGPAPQPLPPEQFSAYDAAAQAAKSGGSNQAGAPK